jgi:steroid delta-isomerase-like uncharacterized protein
MSAQDNARLAREVYEAFNEGDFERILEHVTEDLEVLDVAHAQTSRGPEGLRQFYGVYRTMAPDDGHVEVSAQLSSEEGVTNECIFRATHTGPLPTPAGEIAATGHSVELPFVEVWRIREGKITSIHGYHDSATIMRQLGIGPPTEG